MGGSKTPLPIFLSPFTSSALIITTFHPLSANSLHHSLSYFTFSILISKFSLSEKGKS